MLTWKTLQKKLHKIWSVIWVTWKKPHSLQASSSFFNSSSWPSKSSEKSINGISEEKGLVLVSTHLWTTSPLLIMYLSGTIEGSFFTISWTHLEQADIPHKQVSLLCSFYVSLLCSQSGFFHILRPCWMTFIANWNIPVESLYEMFMIRL